MKLKTGHFLFCFVISTMAVALIGQNSATEAHHRLSNSPYVRGNPGSGRKRHRWIAEPNGDTFANDQAFIEKIEDINEALVP